MKDDRAKFWWGVSFLCNLVAVWFIQPLLVLLIASGTLGTMARTPAALVELEAVLPQSATTMCEILCVVALLVGIAAASKAASKAG